MSTKIYNGFRFETNDLNEAYRLVAAMRPAIAAKIAEAEQRAIAKSVQGYIDVAVLMPESAEAQEHAKNALNKAKGEFRYQVEHQKKQPTRNPEYDLGFEVCIIPFDLTPEMHQTLSHIIVGIVYTEQTQWRDWFFEQDGIEDFSYWNSTDKPADMSNIEWNFRDDVWEGALKSSAAPAECGLTISLDPVYLPFNVNDAKVLEFIEPRSVRAMRYARNLVVEGRAAAHKRTNEATMRDIVRADDWSRTPEGRVEIERLSRDIEPRLPEITMKMFKGSY